MIKKGDVVCEKGLKVVFY